MSEGLLPLDFPHLYKFYDKTWGEMAGTRIKDARLKAIVWAQRSVSLSCVAEIVKGW